MLVVTLGEQARAGLLSSGGSLPATSSTRLLRTVSNHGTHHHTGLPAAACPWPPGKVRNEVGRRTPDRASRAGAETDSRMEGCETA